MEISRIGAGDFSTRQFPLAPASSAGRVELVDAISQALSIGVLKRALDFQANAVTKLLQSLPVIQDPALGNTLDIFA